MYLTQHRKEGESHQEFQDRIEQAQTKERETRREAHMALSFVQNEK